MRKTVFLGWAIVLASIQSLSAQINSGSPAKPFGSNASYSYGIMPATLPSGGTYGKSQAAADAYNTWKSTYVESCGSGRSRVKFDQTQYTVSEGIAYGMLLSVYAGDKALFDGLWAYYKNFRNGNGVMHWKIDGCNSVNQSNGATDAEFDAAMALIVADVQWPSGGYKAEANDLIGKIRSYEMKGNGHVKPGDAWDDKKNPSYYAPAYYREFAKVNTANASFWNTTAITASNDLLGANRHATTGLVSDWANENGTVNGGNTYGYESVRNPWRMATDVLWNGPSVATRAADICGKVAAHIKGDETNLKIACGTGSKLSSGGDKNGAAYMTACASMGSSEQSSLNSLYTHLANTANFQWDAYYSATLRCITLFMMTGNFWCPSTPLCISGERTLTYNYNYTGSTNTTAQVCSGDPISRPADPTRTGYTFTNWYTAATGGTVFNFANGITANTTIYAQWTTATTTVVADCENGNETCLGSSWYSYSDVKDNNGLSVVTPDAGSDFTMTAGGAAGTANYARIDYTLNKGGNLNSPFVGMGFAMAEPKAIYDLSAATGISFYYKGSASRFKVNMGGAGDTETALGWNAYGYDITASTEWKLVTITWSQLAQLPGWGTPMPGGFNPALIVEFQWQVDGATGNTGWVGVDEVQITDTKLAGVTCGGHVSVTTAENATFAIYPNPAQDGNFNVTLPDNETAVLTIANLQGQAVYSAVVKDGFASINTNLGAGVYIVSVQSESGLRTQKLVIK